MTPYVPSACMHACMHACVHAGGQAGVCSCDTRMQHSHHCYGHGNKLPGINAKTRRFMWPKTRAGGRAGGRAEGQTDGRMDRLTDGRTDRRTEVRRGRQKDKQTDTCMNSRTHVCLMHARRHARESHSVRLSYFTYRQTPVVHFITRICYYTHFNKLHLHAYDLMPMRTVWRLPVLW